MLKLKIERPNTVGVTYENEYDNYAEAEDFIERRVEKLCDQGWEASELASSNSLDGIIELTHDNHADVILIKWNTRSD